jgi:hypothetical protein
MSQIGQNSQKGTGNKSYVLLFKIFVIVGIDW